MENTSKIRAVAIELEPFSPTLGQIICRNNCILERRAPEAHAIVASPRFQVLPAWPERERHDLVSPGVCCPSARGWTGVPGHLSGASAAGAPFLFSPRASCERGEAGRGRRGANIHSGSAGRWPGAQSGRTSLERGFRPAGSPTMHQVPSADKTGLCSLEARDRNGRGMCLFLRASGASSGSMVSSPIRLKQSKPRACFSL